MNEDNTTRAVQRYLVELGNEKGQAPSEPLVRELLGRATGRLHLLCVSMLRKHYPRLMKPPLNLEADELLSSVVERMLKALRKVKPESVRGFFAMANQHMRWELNDLARRLDDEVRAGVLHASRVAAPSAPSTENREPSPTAVRMLQAIQDLPDDEREVFELLRVQGMTFPAAAEVLGVSTKTVQRRLNRGLMLLSDTLGDIAPEPSPES